MLLQGAEEIDGFGVCDCDDGYEGELCDTCEDGFYNESNTCHGKINRTFCVDAYAIAN